ncbi:dockerin type I domain-containing protein, partial [Candidatus Omnitrophota bacterium]
VDDNAALDHDWWIEMSQKYGFKVTWFVITSRVSAGSSGGGINGNWGGFRRLYNLGHDLQSHTVNHSVTAENVDYEYGESIRILEEQIPGNKVLVLAYPSPGKYYTNPDIARNYFIGARGVVGTLNQADNIDYMRTNSISSFTFDTDHWASITNILRYNSSRERDFRAWQCMHFHSVGDRKNNLIQGFEYMKQHENDLWTGTFREVVLYGQERDTANVTVRQAGASQIRLSVTDRQDDRLFDYPLTVKVRLDSSWNNLYASQDSRQIDARLVTHGGARYALVNVVPDRGEAILSKQPGTPGPIDILYGDVSENGSISAYDASLAAQYAVGSITLTASQITKADVTGNGDVSATDASWVARKAVDSDVELPVE